MAVPSRCAECGRNFDPRARARTGRLPLTCSAECARARERRQMEGWRKPLPVPNCRSEGSRLDGGWRCAECHCTVDAANRIRAGLGLVAITHFHRTCSPACARVRQVRNYNAWIVAGCSPAWKERAATWHCSECGLGRAAAERKRRRLGLRRLVGYATTCSPRCGLLREKRRWRARYGPAYWKRIQSRQRRRAEAIREQT